MRFMSTLREQTSGDERPDSAADSGVADLGKEPLQVRIPARVKRQFKAAAAMRGLAPHELFVEVWDHYRRTRAE